MDPVRVTRDISLTLWAVLCTMAVIGAALTRASKGRFATLPEVLRVFTAARPRSVVMFVLWMWAGWHFFAR